MSSRFAAALILGAAASLSLGGCASRPPTGTGDTATLSPDERRAAWAQQLDAVSRLQTFTIQGRLSSAELGARGDYRWQQRDDGLFSLRVSGPLGAGATEFTGDEYGVTVRSRSGTETTPDPENWIYQRYGWTLPISGLRWWARGLPAPHLKTRQLSLDGRGRLALLQQGDWTLHYPEYQDVDGLALPRRIEASNGSVKLLLLLDSWTTSD